MITRQALSRHRYSTSCWTRNTIAGVPAGDTYLYKQVPSNVRDPVGEAAAQDAFYRSQEARYKGLAGEKTMVDKVLLTGNDDNFMVVKTLVRHVRCAPGPCSREGCQLARRCCVLRHSLRHSSPAALARAEHVPALCAAQATLRWPL